MELNETIEETAIRELKEEAGISADKLELVSVLWVKIIILNILMGIKCVPS